jgi:anti-anti-sigma factor
MPERKLLIEQHQGASADQHVLRLEGPLLMSTMGELYEMVRADRSKLLIIDLTDVPLIDSAGIGTLIAAYVNRQNSGGKLALVGVNDRIRHALKAAWVEQLFRFFDSASAAEETLQS